MLDMVFLVPACGNGLRTISRGQKPFIKLRDGTTVFERVMDQCPMNARPEIILPTWSGCDAPRRPATVHFFGTTAGQANTIYKWLELQDEMPEWLLISNCDNAIGQADIAAMLDMIEQERGPTRIATGLTGVVAVTKPDDKLDRWSYCHVNSKGWVNRITEKTEPTEYAVCGVYLLRGTALASFLFGSDLYLSQVLSRMREITVYEVKEYHGWNDIAQIQVWEENHGNHRS